MKYLATYIILFLLTLSVLSGQTPQPEPETPKEQTEKPLETLEKESPKNEKSEENILYPPNKNLQELKQNRRRQKDHFIDKDGDGINDNHCNGTGFQRGKGKGRQRGKK